MKTIMSSCPVLALPDFSQPFIVECDTSGEELGAVMMQNHHPIAFESQKLKDYECHYSIYDKEMLAILHALLNSDSIWWEAGLKSRQITTTSNTSWRRKN